MAASKTDVFFGGVVERVLIVLPRCNAYGSMNYKFVEQSFNKCRNYKEFDSHFPVKVTNVTVDNLPRISSLKTGDACLLVGNGRFIPKEMYLFAKKCFEHNIPVYFIRSNSIEVDSRAQSPIWKTNEIIVKTSFGKSFYLAPKKYFMQIPSLDDFILTSTPSNEFYALFPAMTPM